MGRAPCEEKSEAPPLTLASVLEVEAEEEEEEEEEESLAADPLPNGSDDRVGAVTTVMDTELVVMLLAEVAVAELVDEDDEEEEEEPPPNPVAVLPAKAFAET